MSTLQQRFDAKYERVPGVDCWLWVAATHKFGYGHIRANGKVDVAHRVSYQLHVGQIPNEMCVLHKCDNPACVRPDHLFLGTTLDNIKDKIQKGREAGPKWNLKLNPAAKINKEIAEQIRSDGRSSRNIAASFGLSKSQVKRIKAGASWRTS